MSKVSALTHEFARQLRAIGRRSALSDQELQALVRAVRLTLAAPSPAMLRAGWGHHLNLTDELGLEFAQDDYSRMMEAAFASAESSFEPDDAGQDCFNLVERASDAPVAS
ncbi:hypothetical protein [Alsobacter sp. SYSU BS001988]